MCAPGLHHAVGYSPYCTIIWRYHRLNSPTGLLRTTRSCLSRVRSLALSTICGWALVSNRRFLPKGWLARVLASRRYVPLTSIITACRRVNVSAVLLPVYTGGGYSRCANPYLLFDSGPRVS